MGNTSFGLAKQWVQAGYGDCTPEVTAEVVNAIRQHFYNWYNEIALFLDATECFAVKWYCTDCNTCRDRYRGITLPRECQNVEAMWWNDWPVKVLNSWREYQNGLTPECDCRLKSIDVPGTFSTFDDITPGTSVQLVFVALDPRDYGKKVLIRGIDGGMRPWTESLVLGPDGASPSVPYRVIDHRGGVMKDVTLGRVMLMDTLGRVYGRYEPDETVPSYRRVRITGLGNDLEAVNVRSARKYYPLSDDNDVVETDNRMAFDAMARYLRKYRKVDKSSADLVSEKNDLSTARSMVIGDKAREEGRATQADVVFATPRYRGRRLTRNC